MLSPPPQGKTFSNNLSHDMPWSNYQLILDSEGTPSDSVPHHLLGTRWSVLQPEGCGGCDRRGGQGSEENWKQTCVRPLQVKK